MEGEGSPELIGSRGADRSQKKLAGHGVSPEFLPERFVFHAVGNRYTCLAGKFLAGKGNKRLQGATEKHYRPQSSDCQFCPFRSQCCPQAKLGRPVGSDRRTPEGGGVSAKDAARRVSRDLSTAGSGGRIFQRLSERGAGIAKVPAPRFGKSPSANGLGLPRLQRDDLDRAGVES